MNHFRPDRTTRFLNRILFYVLVFTALRVCGYFMPAETAPSQWERDEELGVAKPYIGIPVEELVLDSKGL